VDVRKRGALGLSGCLLGMLVVSEMPRFSGCYSDADVGDIGMLGCCLDANVEINGMLGMLGMLDVVFFGDRDVREGRDFGTFFFSRQFGL
jgi:hypothetical protein